MLKLILAAGLLAVPVLTRAAEAPSTAAFKQADEAMMSHMDIPYSGDTDRDFVTAMLPHHQGAIDMAKIELQYGHDPALKRLAHAIIDSQAKEQVFMRGWLAKHPAPASPKP